MSAKHVVMRAYTDTGALNIPCPHCDAQTDEPCTKPTGRVSRVPCVARIANADIPLHEAVDNLSPPPVDFGEPRHPREAS